jgi:hypothetical protein
VGKIVGRDDPDPALMKPSPHQIRCALGLLQTEPKECIFIGDSTTVQLPRSYRAATAQLPRYVPNFSLL